MRCPLSRFSTIAALLAGISYLLLFPACASPGKRPVQVQQTIPTAQESQAQPSQQVPEQAVSAISGPSTRSAIEPAEQMPAAALETSVIPVEEEQASAHRIHRVWIWQETGDCLWNMAKKYYGDPWQWKKIYLANRYQIDDPKKIYPKQILIIPPEEEPVE